MTRLSIDISPQEEARLEQLAQKKGQLPTDVLRRFLDEGLDREQPKTLDEPSARPPCVFDLHPGAAEMSDDFDAPLPDSFWLGED